MSRGSPQRWHVQIIGAESVECVFASTEEINTPHTKNLFTFTLISKANNHFESTMSVIASNSLDNAVVECTDFTTRDTVTINIAGYEISFP